MTHATPSDLADECDDIFWGGMSKWLTKNKRMLIIPAKGHPQIVWKPQNQPLPLKSLIYLSRIGALP